MAGSLFCSSIAILVCANLALSDPKLDDEGLRRIKDVILRGLKPSEDVEISRDGENGIRIRFINGSDEPDPTTTDNPAPEDPTDAVDETDGYTKETTQDEDYETD